MDKYNIIKISDVDSTNDYALSFKESRAFREGLVIVSDFQTNGQGQRGSRWESEKGKNLIISVVIEPNISIEKQFNVSKITSLSVVDCLLSFGIESKIKWPNDIIVNKHKIAGILIQNITCKNMITHSVIGIGVNINQLIFDDFFPKATSLKIELSKSVLLEEIQNRLLSALQKRIIAYRLAEYTEFDYLNVLFQKDKISVFESRSQKFNGIIRGVTDVGKLIIETETEVKEYGLKDIRMLF